MNKEQGKTACVQHNSRYYYGTFNGLKSAATTLTQPPAACTALIHKAPLVKRQLHPTPDRK